MKYAPLIIVVMVYSSNSASADLGDPGDRADLGDLGDRAGWGGAIEANTLSELLSPEHSSALVVWMTAGTSDAAVAVAESLRRAKRPARLLDISGYAPVPSEDDLALWALSQPPLDGESKPDFVAYVRTVSDETPVTHVLVTFHDTKGQIFARLVGQRGRPFAGVRPPPPPVDPRIAARSLHIRLGVGLAGGALFALGIAALSDGMSNPYVASCFRTDADGVCSSFGTSENRIGPRSEAAATLLLVGALTVIGVIVFDTRWFRASEAKPQDPRLSLAPSLGPGGGRLNLALTF